MELRERLELLGALGAGRAAGRAATPDRARRPSEAISSAYPLPPLPGRLVRAPLGEFFLAELGLPPDYLHGAARPGRLAEMGPDPFGPAAGPALSGISPARMAFLDVESTGLAGGVGTCAFLVGIGHLDDGEARVRQFFMRDYPDEAAMLDAVSSFLSGFEAVASFNGKAFDWGLLEARCALSRLPPPPALPHFDLLFPARRLWRHRASSCGLASLEAVVLGFERGPDLPGYLIPQRFFDYLRSGDSRLLPAIFRHNAADVLSLMGLAVAMADALSGAPSAASSGPLSGVPFGAPPGPPGPRRDPWELYGAGAMYEAAGMLEGAEACWLGVAGGFAAGGVAAGGIAAGGVAAGLHDGAAVGFAAQAPAGAAARAAWRLSLLYKRQGRWDEAVPLWNALAASGAEHLGRARLGPHVELAKYLEHRRKDFAAARRVALDALDALGPARGGAVTCGAGNVSIAATELAALERRLRRLERKALPG